MVKQHRQYILDENSLMEVLRDYIKKLDPEMEDSQFYYHFVWSEAEATVKSVTVSGEIVDRSEK